MSVRRFLLYLCFLAHGVPAFAQPVGQSDSLFLVLEKLPDRDRVVQVNALFYKLYSADLERANALGESVLLICRKAGWKDQEALILKNLGIANFLLGNYEKTLRYYQNALSVFEQNGDAGGQGGVCNELALFFKKRKETKRALEYLDRSARLCAEAPDTICLATAMDNRGLILLESGNLEAADSLFRQVLALRQAIRDSVGLSYVYNNLAEIAFEQSRMEEALDYLGRSTEIRRQLGDRQGVAININNVGEALMATGAPDKAISFFEQSLEESRAIHFDDLSRHTMEMLASAHRELGNYQTAFDWLKQSYALKDSLFSIKRSAQIAEMQEKYETGKRENELLSEQLRVRKRTAWLILASVLAALLAVILVLALRQYRQRQAQLLYESAMRENLFQKEKESELQQERLRIFRDLHDHLGAELTLIRSALSRRIYLSQLPEEKKELGVISDNARRAMEELRETVWAIGGEENTVENVALRVQDFSSRFENEDIQVEWGQEVGALQLNATQTLHLYRIAQEALHNALKHAPGSSIRIAFSIENGALLMAISDTGAGFGTAPPRQGHGLRNMQERAKEIGAHCDIRSTNDGLSVWLTLPL